MQYDVRCDVRYDDAVRQRSTTTQYDNAVRQCGATMQYDVRCDVRYDDAVRRCGATMQYGTVQRCDVTMRCDDVVQYMTLWIL